MPNPRNHLIGGYLAGRVPSDAKRRQTGKFQSEELPPKVDLRKYLTSIEEQVGNSCVANAFAGAYEYLAKRELGDSADVSRLFIYYNARSENGDEKKDSGSYMEYAINGLKKYGACTEDLWANHEKNITKEPVQEAYDHGANFTVEEAEYVETELDLWKHTLAEGFPIVFSLNTFDSFDEATDNKGRVPMPKRSDNVRDTHGWHAMLCVGYSDPDKMFIVRNSWGASWGDKGYCYIPYSYMLHEDYNGNDAWMIKTVSDLDYSADVGDSDETSNFAQDGSIQLEAFYVAVEDTDGVDQFATDLEKLCKKYSGTEEDYYFDYEETEENDQTYIEIKNFDLTVEDEDAFLEDLEALCQEYTEDDYDFSIIGAEEEVEEEEVEEEEVEEEEEEIEVYAIALSEFWCYTDDTEAFSTALDKLCEKYAAEGEYGFEYEELEDENEVAYINITDFTIETEDYDGFMEKLEKLCVKHGGEEGYSWEEEE
jgi:C1A family cysteine protease